MILAVAYRRLGPIPSTSSSTGQTPSGDGELFTQDELELLIRTQAALSGAYRDAAATSGAELLAMWAASSDHALGSMDPWVFGFKSTVADTAGSFHPNELGMQAVADALTRLVG
ncbi:hypothetical protein D1871_22285 [Nakamurella silvestris]|nr:hypothetical protein D1871_22285 [Nakamurella silvestris]